MEVRSDLDDGETKDIFNKALELVNEKFPLPDVRIRELHIYEDPLYMMRRPRFSISYGENGATLIQQLRIILILKVTFLVLWMKVLKNLIL